MPDEKFLVEMKNISKYYPGVHALSDVSFTLKAGEVHSICGENGAGKSTLIKILTGAETPDGGEIYLKDQLISPKTPLEAQKQGISTVYQEVNLCPNLSVAENIYIGRQPRDKIGGISRKEINRRSKDAMKRLHIDIDVTAKLDEFSVALQQMVAIARALDVNAKVLVLDEPTSSLNAQEVRDLFAVIRSLKEQGIGIIFISHFIDQIYEITDRITILRNGVFQGVHETACLPRMELITKMIGKELIDFEKEIDTGIGEDGLPAEKEVLETYFQAENLGRTGTIKPFNISLKKGQVTGLAGLLGSGRTETARLIFGVDRADSGSVKINGKPVRIKSPTDAVGRGMGFCPENRKTEGIIANMTIRENIALALQGRMGTFKRMTVKKQSEIAEKYIKALSIATPTAEQLVGNLSGGNQQKVLLARWLATNPELLIVDEPTRGIDVGAKAEIQKLVVELAKDGKSVLFISSELEEVIRCSTNVLVYRDLVQTKELSDNEISGASILKAIAGDQEEGGMEN